MNIIVLSALAGICGTGLGGAIIAVVGKRSAESMCWMLSFAGGVMTSIVCFGLVPEAVELSGIAVSVAGLVLGVAVIMALNLCMDASGSAKNNKGRKLHQTHAELYHEGPLLSKNNSQIQSGLVMLIAIGLHNIPEGMAIGSSGSHDIQLGYLLALIIALHNIPEGMAIAAPLLSGGFRKIRVVYLTALSGAPTLLGGVIGLLIGSISNTAIALSLAGAGGAMLYVVFGEIIPQSVVMTKSRVTTLVALFGIIVGLLATLL